MYKKIFSNIFLCVRRVPPPVWRQQRDPVQEGQQHGGREVGHLVRNVVTFSTQSAYRIVHTI